MKHIKLILVSALTMLACLINFTGHVSASTTYSQPITYDDLRVRMIFPKEQYGTAPYFNLILKQGESTRIGFKLKNNSDKKVDVKLTPCNASSKDGKVVYDQETRMIYNHEPMLTDFISGKNVSLKGKQTKQIWFNLKGKPITTSVLGAIAVQESGKANKLNAGIRLQNKMATRQLSDSRSFSLLNNQIERIGKKGGVVWKVMMMNNGDLINGANVTANIMHNGKKIAKVEKNNVSLAPNSSFPLDLYFKTENAIDGGKYKLLVNVVSGDDTFGSQSVISLSDAQAEKINRKVGLRKKKKAHVNWLAWGCTVLAVGIGGYIAVDLIRHKDE